MKKSTLVGLAVTFSFMTVSVMFQNCGQKLKSSNLINDSSQSSGFIINPNEQFNFGSKAFDGLSLSNNAEDLKFGSQVKTFGVYPTITLSNESIDPERFKMLLQELQGRSNVVTLSYISDQMISLGNEFGLVSKRKLNALALLDEKLAMAQSMGFNVALEVTSAFFDFDSSHLRFDVSKFKINSQTEWQGIAAIAKKYSNIIWFYPMDEPYWAAKNEGVLFSDMKLKLDHMNALIKTDFPQVKIVFIEAFAVINDNFQIPNQTDLVGMDCYGNFDNCFGESVPSYYNKLMSRMNSEQKLIIIPDAFDFKANDLNGPWQDNVIAQSKKYIKYSKDNPRVEAVVSFIYNAPFEKNLNLENLAATRQNSLLSYYFDQVSLQNKSLVRNAQAENPIIHFSYIDKQGFMTHAVVSDEYPEIKILPKDNFDISFYRPLSAHGEIDCVLFDPLGHSQSCNELIYRQSRVSSKGIKSGAWIFQFKLKNQITVQRKITLIEQAEIVVPPPLPSLTINCPGIVIVGGTGSCTATASAELTSGYWTVNGERQPEGNSYSYTWSNIPGPALYSVQGFAIDKLGRKISSNIIKVSAVSPTLSIVCNQINFVVPSVACSVTASGRIQELYWRVNGIKDAGSENQFNRTWSNIQRGTYQGDVFAKDLSNNIIKSPIITITVW